MRAARQCPNAGNDFPPGDGFDQQFVSTNLQGDNPVYFNLVARQHNDSGAGLASELRQMGQCVYAPEPLVENNDIWGKAFDVELRGILGSRVSGFQVIVVERSHQFSGEGHIVIDDENLAGRFGPDCTGILGGGHDEVVPDDL